MFVNKIWSSKTQLPYNYYSLPFCKPDTVETEKENIGQILIGDRIQNSDYQVSTSKIYVLVYPSFFFDFFGYYFFFSTTYDPNTLLIFIRFSRMESSLLIYFYPLTLLLIAIHYSVVIRG